MADLLVDTDVFIDHLRGARPVEAGRNRIHYSVVTRCELFSGRSAIDTIIRELLAPFAELHVDRAVSERAGLLRRETGLRTPDALIAATALLNRLALVTRNARDFEAIRGLTVRQP